MGIISNMANFSQGVFFNDYRHFVTDEIYLASLRYTFERIKRKSDEEKIKSILNLEKSEENVTAKDFANLEGPQGVSLLQLAASNLNAGAVEILLENGADVNHVSLKSPLRAHSPLIYALGNRGKIIYPTRDNFYDLEDYEKHLEEEQRRVMKEPKDFEKFKKTIDLLISHGGAAISPLSLIFTDKQADRRTGRELVEFAISFLDNDENCNFYKLDENGQKIELPKDDMMKYLLTISYFRENLSPELLSYAKQNDYNAFRTLLDAVDDKITMLNDIHRYESIELAYYNNQTILYADDMRRALYDMQQKGIDLNNIPICPERFAFQAATDKFTRAKYNHDVIASAHMVLTEYDSPETFNFKITPYYDYRYIEGEVVNLHQPNLVTATAYLKEAEGDEEFAMENYTQDIIETYPRILKHGNLNHFIGLMEGEFSKLNSLESMFDGIDFEEEK